MERPPVSCRCEKRWVEVDVIGRPAVKIPFYNVAKQTVTAGVQYLVPLDTMGQLMFTADYYWSSKVSQANYQQPSYDLVNRRASWNDVAGSPMDLSVFATNVFNKGYVQITAASGAGLGFTSVLYGPPRQVGVSLRYRFGG